MRNKKGAMKLFVIIAIIAVVIILLFFFFIKPKIIDKNVFHKCVDDNQCFLKYANKCYSVEMTRQEGTANISYATKNCLFVKEIVSLSDIEDNDTKNALQGKRLTCKYEKGNFNSNWIDALSLDLENCTGDLKDSIDDLIKSLTNSVS